MLWFPSSLILEWKQEAGKSIFGEGILHALPSGRRKVSETGAEGTPRQWSPTWGGVLPGEHEKMDGNSCSCHIQKKSYCIQWVEMLLNILQHTEWAHVNGATAKSG